MTKRRGPGESLRRNPGPREQVEPDVEGHGLADILTRPIDAATGQPTAGRDGIVHLPRTGGEDIPDPTTGPEGRRNR